MTFQLDFGFGTTNKTTADSQPPLQDKATPSSKFIPNTHATTTQIDVLLEPVVIYSGPPTQRTHQHTLFRRSTQDVEFQLAQEDESLGEITTTECTDGVSTAIRTNSDLIAGTYEGGLKTWECSLDLIEYLISRYYNQNHTDAVDQSPPLLTGLSVLELGCGSALPGIFALQSLNAARVDFQDYNSEVLRLVTIPNVLCNTLDLEQAKEGVGSGGEVSIDLSRVGEFSGSPKCDFYSGDWASLHVANDSRQYDLILSSETIYSPASYHKIVLVLKNCLSEGRGVALFACKQVYFGCGGDVQSFKAYLLRTGGFAVREVWGTSEGLRRVVVEVRKV